MKGWRAKPLLELPDGYELREDSTFCYLYRGNDMVGIFGPHASMELIRELAEKHQKGELEE